MSNALLKATCAVLFVVGFFGSLFSGRPVSAQAVQSSAAQPTDAQTPDAAATPKSNPLTAEWLVGNAVSDANSPQYKDVTDAITRFANNDPNGARELLTSARKANPKLPPVELMMGRLWLAARQPAAGRAELESAAVKYPTDPEAFLYFAEASIAEHRIADADAMLLKVKPLVDGYSENLKRKRNFQIRLNNAMAGLNESRTQWEAALPYLKAWLELDPDSVDAHQRMGNTLFQLGKTTEAYKEFEAAAKVEPKAVNPYIALAQLYESAKDRTNAAKSIGYAVQNNPKDLNVQLMAARWAYVTNQLNEAQKYADRALQIDPKSQEARIMRGVIARYTGDFKTAESLLEQAVTASPGNLEASNQLALVLIEQDDKDKKDRALQIAELDLKQQGDRVTPDVAATYAWVLYKLGKTAEAEQILGKVFNAGVMSPDTAFYIATILRDRGKPDAAIRLLESAIARPEPFAQRQATADLLAKLKKDQEQQKASGKDAASPATGSK
jgi:tetratricopeptide (TPR) repeat protein